MPAFNPGHRAGRLWLGILLYLAGLSACGFHLQSSMQAFAGQNIWIVRSAPDRVVIADLISGIQARGLVPAKSRAAADRMLAVSNFALTRKVAALNSLARPSEYELLATARFQMFSAAGKELYAGDVQASRIYSRVASNLLAGSREEAVIRAELRQYLIEQILTRASIQEAALHQTGLQVP